MFVNALFGPVQVKQTSSTDMIGIFNRLWSLSRALIADYRDNPAGVVIAHRYLCYILFAT